MNIGAFIADLVTDPFVMIILGALTNLLQRVIDYNDKNENKISVLQYIRNNPYRIAISVVGLLVGYSVLIQLGELTIFNSLGVGYFSHSIVEIFASKVSTNQLSDKMNKDK